MTPEPFSSLNHRTVPAPSRDHRRGLSLACRGRGSALRHRAWTQGAKAVHVQPVEAKPRSRRGDGDAQPPPSRSRACTGGRRLEQAYDREKPLVRRIRRGAARRLLGIVSPGDQPADATERDLAVDELEPCPDLSAGVVRLWVQAASSSASRLGLFVGAAAELDASNDAVAEAAGAALVPFAVHEQAGDPVIARPLQRYFAQAVGLAGRTSRRR